MTRPRAVLDVEAVADGLDFVLVVEDGGEVAGQRGLEEREGEATQRQRVHAGLVQVTIQLVLHAGRAAAFEAWCSGAAAFRYGRAPLARVAL
eukprot:4465149-Prymnesium_polylepis.1